jgi:hypothetical protein
MDALAIEISNLISKTSVAVQMKTWLLNTSLQVSTHLESGSEMPPGNFCTFKPHPAK